jgi:small subunit ribosomal protein S4
MRGKRRAWCRICRRLGTRLFLKGEKCDTDKCTFKRKEAPPGEPPKRRPMRESPYAIHLREKQRTKFIYGVKEKQLKKYYQLASKRKGRRGEILLQLLERRLDNVIYRLGYSHSRHDARQLITHGHFVVNEEKVDIPSYLVKIGDKIGVKEKSKDLIKSRIKEGYTPPKWLNVQIEKLEAQVIDLPKREDMLLDINENLIIELYSK